VIARAPILHVIASTLVALVMGTSFAHVLEWPAKLLYDAELYGRIQTSLYAHWGPPGIGGFLEPAAILAVMALAWVVRRDRTALAMVGAAAALLLLAFPVIFLWRVEPANDVFRAILQTGSPPQDWAHWRMQWESGHAMRFGAHLVAFILLLSTLAWRRDFASASPRPSSW